MGFRWRCASFGEHISAAVSALEAGYGHCASKGKTYYGFHGHLNITADGVITSFCLTPAGVDEREACWEVVTRIHGVLIGDKGYISTQLKADLLHKSIDLQTQLRDNMSDSRPSWWLKRLKRVRRLVETVIGQLVGRFQIERVWARDLWHLTGRLNRKLLAHTVCRWGLIGITLILCALLIWFPHEQKSRTPR